jgi:hypothetical protein
MSSKEAAITAVYRQIHAPEWAQPNLDGLADVLRDLSWLPAGPVPVDVPELDGLTDGEREMLLHVLARAMSESADTERPVRLRRVP